MRPPYDLVKMGLVDFINEKVANGEKPTDHDLLLEARQIYKSLDGAAKGRRYRGISWLRDLFMTGTSHVGPKNSERADLMGFQSNPTCGSGRCCPNESKLREFVASRIAIASPPTTAELQAEACRILTEAEQTSSFPCEPALTWFTHLITSSSDWLDDFRRRVNLPLKFDLSLGDTCLADGEHYDIYNSAHLEKGLILYVNSCTEMGVDPPTSADLQRQARLLVFGVDDPQYSTLADDPTWLDQFKRRYDHTTHAAEPRTDQLLIPEMQNMYAAMPSSITDISLSPSPPLPTDTTLHWDLSPSPSSGSSNPQAKETAYDPMASRVTEFVRLSLPHYTQNMDISNPTLNPNPQSASPDGYKAGPRRYFFSDANCYRRLMFELSRFVASCISVNNPNPHVPSDEELQRQARWILYDDDDPWNQTAADNEEWLKRFKRDVGMLGKDENTGLGLSGLVPWMPPVGSGGF
jgi:hypothetical protein